MPDSIIFEIIEGLQGPTLLLAVWAMFKIFGLQKDLKNLVERFDQHQQEVSAKQDRQFDLLISEIREVRRELHELTRQDFNGRP